MDCKIGIFHCMHTYVYEIYAKLFQLCGRGGPLEASHSYAGLGISSMCSSSNSIRINRTTTNTISQHIIRVWRDYRKLKCFWILKFLLLKDMATYPYEWDRKGYENHSFLLPFIYNRPVALYYACIHNPGLDWLTN